MNEYRLVRYEERYHEAAAWFRHRVFGSQVSRSSAFLRWKYVDNPYYHDPSIYLALSGDRVVGMRGICGGSWEANGQDPVVLLTAVDTALDPAYRDGSLYRELNEFAFTDLATRGHHRIISLSPTPEAYLAAVLTMGWKRVGSLAYQVRSKGPSAFGTTKLGARARLGALIRRVPLATSLVRWHRKRAPFSRFDKQLSRLTTNSHLMISDTAHPEAMADLVERIGTDGRIRHVRDITYLTWRYRNPSNAYRFIYWGKDSLEGYVALMRGTTMAPAYILDWEAADPDVAKALLAAVVRSNSFADLRIWGVHLAPARLDMLAETGFVEPPVHETSRYADRFIVRALTSDSDERPLELGSRRLDRVTDWDLRMVYSTAF